MFQFSPAKKVTGFIRPRDNPFTNGKEYGNRDQSPKRSSMIETRSR